MIHVCFFDKHLFFFSAAVSGDGEGCGSDSYAGATTAATLVTSRCDGVVSGFGTFIEQDNRETKKVSWIRVFFKKIASDHSRWNEEKV